MVLFTYRLHSMVKNIYLIAPLNDYPLPHSNLTEKHTVSAVVCAIYYSEYARTFIVSWACHRHDQRGCGQRRCGGVGRGGLLRRVCMTLWGCGLCLLPLGAIDIDPRGQLNNHESFLSTYSGLHWRLAMKARPFSSCRPNAPWAKGTIFFIRKEYLDIFPNSQFLT